MKRRGKNIYNICILVIVRHNISYYKWDIKKQSQLKQTLKDNRNGESIFGIMFTIAEAWDEGRMEWWVLGTLVQW